MTPITLREHQNDLDRGVIAAVRGGSRRVLVQSDTGTGKTVYFSHVTKRSMDHGRTSLIIVPRRELAFQAQKKLLSFGIHAGLLMSGEEMNLHRPIQVGSFDTLHARMLRRKSGKLELPPFDVVHTDEAHLSVAESRLAVLRQFPDAIHFGYTATPARGDGKPLRGWYDSLVLGWPTRRLMEECYLIPEVHYYAPSIPDLSKVKRNKDGDYAEGSLSEAMDKPKLVGEIVDNWLKIVPGKSTAVFCVTRKHGLHVLEAFKRAGVAAEYVDGDTPHDERADIMRRVDNGTTTVLVNVYVATYGLDIPTLEVVVIARPTKNITLYRQIVGRALRPVYADGYDLETLEGRVMAICESGKPRAYVIDHSGAVLENGFIDEIVPWTLDGDESVKAAKERAAQEKAEPKEIRCPKCATIFKGTRYCPKCGHHLIPAGEPIPTYAADLVQIDREGKAANQKLSLMDKQKFYAQCLQHEIEKRYKAGFAAKLYREKFGVMPPDPVRLVRPEPVGAMLKGFLAHQAIARKHR